MIKNAVARIALVIVIMASVSCNKWLEIKPQDGLTSDEFWQTKEQVESAVVGCYIYMTENSVVNQLFRWGELRADMIKEAPAPGGPGVDELNIIQGNILSTNPLVKWGNIYKVINNCNLVIDNAPKVLQRDPTFTLEQLNIKLAEVHAIRALMYFYLVRTFHEVPLQLKGVAEDRQIEQLAKSTEDVLIQQILADLKFAEANAVASFSTKAMNKGRITKYGVYAMEADVYLWNKDYKNAIIACDNIISSNQFGLIEGSKSNDNLFQSLYFEGNSNESIFEFQYTADKPNLFYSFFISPRLYVANEAVMSRYFITDPNDATDRDLRGAGVAYNPTNYSIWKYNGRNGDITALAERGGAAASIGHYIIYRYADVLLMKAEALALQGGQQAEVISIINQIRTRALASVATNPNLNANSSTSELTTAVFNERAREFAFEGKRWFDVLRYARRDNFGAEQLISIATENTPANAVRNARARLKDPNSWYLPINYDELLADKLLVQNPFYF